MIDWAIVGVTAAGLILVIASIIFIGSLINKCIDYYLELKNKINNYFE